MMRRQNLQQGAAIILVLALIVLVSMVIVAFLARTNTEQQISAGSTNSSKADQLVRSACDAIVADLKEEIASSSTTSTVNGVTVYLPINSSSAIVPSRTSGTTGQDAPNLIKFSGTAPFFPASPAGAVASTASTVTPSLNGRSVSPARWNASYLLPRDPNLIASGSLGTSPDMTYFSAPNWVIVTRSGTAAQNSLGFSGSNAVNNAAPGNPNYAIGRYGYMVYNEGGLLDANATGCPSITPGGIAQTTYGHKGGIAFADLTQLTGANGVSLMTSAQVDNLLGWRNYASTHVSGSFGAYQFDTTSSTNYYNFVLSSSNALLTNTSGGLTVATGSYNGATDQLFLNRQQLIQFSRSSGISQDALQFLGTFSREENAPSLSGTNPTVASTDINPWVLAVRFAGSGTLTRYRLDGTPDTTVQVHAGDPVVEQRFPLGRIAWLTPDGPASAGLAAPIKQHFGLVWESPSGNMSGRWHYVSPDGGGATTTGTSIKTLSQVSQITPPREPDFFELLKAGIWDGSLGKTSGTTAGGNAGFTFNEDVNRDIQILKIGANIIDQFDADSIPTAIHFKNIKNNTEMDVFGTESLPYITRVMEFGYRPLNPVDRSVIGAWYGFMVWDPHQNANSNLMKSASDPNAPVLFRIRAVPDLAGNMGLVQLRVMFSGRTPESGTVTWSSPAWEYATPVLLDQNHYIPFSRVPAGTTFDEPTILTPDHLNGATTTSSLDTVSVPSGSSAPGILGINAGTISSGTYWVTGTTTAGVTGSSSVMSNTYSFAPQNTVQAPCFEIQCFDPVGQKWHIYQQWKELTTGGGALSTTSAAGLLNVVAGGNFFTSDPRTVRFGGSISRQGVDVSVLNNTATMAQNVSLWNSTVPRLQAGSIISLGSWSRTGTGWYDSGGPHVPNPGNLQSDVYSPLLCYNNQGVINTYNMNDGSNPTVLYYSDPDGHFRIADSAKGLFPMKLQASGTWTCQDRPLILNRPFRSVGELGYAYRDLPWRTLDFWTNDSPDAGLLDLFTVSDYEVMAGKVSLNTRNPAVLAALISGAQTQAELPAGATGANNISATGTLSGTQALSIGKALVARTSGTAPQVSGVVLTSGSTGPLLNVRDLAAELSGTTYSTILTGLQAIVKGQRESIIRSLADVADTRTWNLMIDVIAQTGRYGKTASTLDQFVVEGERRYWVHVAIDRFTGKIIDQQWEVVNE